MKPIQDVQAFIRGAIAKADAIALPAVQRLLLETNGPTEALLVLHVARAEIVRIVRERTPPEQMPEFLRSLGQLERAFEDQQRTLRGAVSQSLRVVRGIRGRVGEGGPG